MQGLHNRMKRFLVLPRVLVLPTILLILNLADTLTTRYGLSLGLAEANPFFSFTATPLKFLGCGTLFVTSFLQNRLHPKAKSINDVILGIVIAVYVCVVLNNMLTIALLG